MPTAIEVDVNNLLANAIVERDKVLTFLEAHVETLSDDDYAALDAKHGELVAEVSRLNGLSAVKNIQGLDVGADTIKRTTQKINDTIIALERITDYLGLLDDFVQLAEGVVSTNPQVIKEAITSAAKKINDW
jgi:hypothetical protein